MNSAASETPSATRESKARPLCAYSPRWLSGPVPGYQGLCATWNDEVDDALGDVADDQRPFV
jgi:hypothetical protein